MAFHFLLLSFLGLLLNNGASSYIPSQDLNLNYTAEAPSYNISARQRHHEEIVFNVDDYGAKADGSDDYKAFKRAWKAACNSTSEFSVLVVARKKTYLLNPIMFSGPCEARSITVMEHNTWDEQKVCIANCQNLLGNVWMFEGVTFSDYPKKINGKLKAPSNRSIWLEEEDLDYWIRFRNVKHLTVKGGGKLDGSGQVWWQNSCKINDSMLCVHGPTCKQLRVSDLTLMDGQQMHVIFSYCTNVEASHLIIRAPEWSPNTDGIHLTSTRHMTISNCFIGTGDDCISIVNGSKNVFVQNTVCGPGHGISIGSLGSNGSEAHVSNVFVEKATLIGTTNGVRIKTWQGGHGSAKNIVFQDISMNNVSNPIIINQNYCDSKKPCYQQRSVVAIKGVIYKNIRGTSTTDISININCIHTVPCRHIDLQDISLVTPDTFESSSSCINVHHSKESGSVFPSCHRRRH